LVNGTYFDLPLINPPLVNNGFPATPPELFEAQTFRDWEVWSGAPPIPNNPAETPQFATWVIGDLDNGGLCFPTTMTVPNVPGTVAWEFVLTPAGNCGWYRWRIVLQEKPHSNINLKIRGCILENEGGTVYKMFPDCGENDGCPGPAVGQTVSDSAAGETGAFHLNSNIINFIASANPTLKVWAEPGPYSTFSTPFNMTGIMIPSGMSRTEDDMVVLDGSADTRFNLIGNFAANIVLKFPEAGTNDKGQEEAVLHQGDMIEILVSVPSNNVVDIRLGRDSAWLEYNAIVGTSITVLPALPWSVGPQDPLSLDDYLNVEL
jgi:hypothetical protein